MIKVIPNHDYKRGWTILGHAEFGTHGQDIVCASVSVLSQVLGYEIWSVGRAFVHTESGHMEVHIEIPNQQTHTLSRAFKRGIEQIASQYPDNVEIIHEKLSAKR